MTAAAGTPRYENGVTCRFFPSFGGLTPPLIHPADRPLLDFSFRWNDELGGASLSRMVESGTCLHSNRPCRLPPARQCMKMRPFQCPRIRWPCPGLLTGAAWTNCPVASFPRISSLSGPSSISLSLLPPQVPGRPLSVFAPFPHARANSVHTVWPLSHLQLVPARNPLIPSSLLENRFPASVMRMTNSVPTWHYAPGRIRDYFPTKIIGPCNCLTDEPPSPLPHNLRVSWVGCIYGARRTSLGATFQRP